MQTTESQVRRNIFVGVVEDNKDPNRKGRIKVRVQDVYDEIPLEDIPYAAPFGGLAGKAYQVPAIGKLVNVLYLTDDIYDPYYIFSENYNINLQNKLKDLSDEEYVDFVALLFDERTQIFADSQELTIDHLYNKMTINNDSINMELKDNKQLLNLGSKGSKEDAVLGTTFFNWLDDFMNELGNPVSLIGNSAAPIQKPKLEAIIKNYQRLRGKHSFLSKHVKIVENDNVSILKRPTDNRKNDVDLVIDQKEMSDNAKARQKELQDKINGVNDSACRKGKQSKSSTYTPTDNAMLLPLVGKRISSKFGDMESGLRSKPHNGIDIVDSIGTPIKSPANGIVILAEFQSKGGNTIRIKHTNGFSTGYCHLSALNVKKNDMVVAGDVIGLVGNTGEHTTGAHLHFTVTTPSGQKADPELYFYWPDTENKTNLLADSYQGQEYNQGNNNCKDDGDADYTDYQDQSPLDTDFDNPKFVDVTKKVVEKLEGGYYHPNMLSDGRVKDKRYNKSGETMFGIDRRTGGIINTSVAGLKFWKIIDDADAKNKWKWNYMGGNLKDTLMPLVAEMMKPQFDSYSRKYLSVKALEVINSDKRLLFHFIYAAWNGPGWFQKFATKINNQVNHGNTDPEMLAKLAVESRQYSGNSLIAQGGAKIQKLFNTNFA